MESIALLTNLVRRAVKAHPNVRPSRAELREVFQQYQDRRVGRMKKIMEFSGLITRVQAWDGFLMKFAAKVILPYQNKTQLGKDIGDIIKDAEKLDFVPLKSRGGRIPWKNEDGGITKQGTASPAQEGRSWGSTVIWGLIMLSSLSLVVLKTPISLLLSKGVSIPVDHPVRLIRR